MADERVQLGEDGVVVIPAAYRAAMGLKGGEMLHLRLDEEGLHIQSQLTGPGTVRTHVSEELIAGRRTDAKHERAGLEPTRGEAIQRAQSTVRRYTQGRTGLVEEFLRERREESLDERRVLGARSPLRGGR